MLIIRLQRTGKKGQAYFRVVILEHTSRVKGEFLELLGSYNPHEKEFKVKKDRIEYWLSKGAQLSPTVNNLLVNYKIMDRPKVQSWKPKKSGKQQETGGQAKEGLIEQKPEIKKEPHGQDPKEEVKPMEAKAEEAVSENENKDKSPKE